jgi:hypothetical protein
MISRGLLKFSQITPLLVVGREETYVDSAQAKGGTISFRSLDFPIKTYLKEAMVK